MPNATPRHAITAIIFPLLLLLALAAISAVLSYFFLALAGDVLSMRRIVSKATQIFLLASIFPLRHYLRLSWADIGFAPSGIFWRQLRQGAGLGLVTLLPVLLTLYALEVSVFDLSKSWDFGKVAVRSAKALLLATLIAFGEEPLFSGILLAGLRRKMAVGIAVGVVALYYAAFHFVKTKTDILYENLSITSGFQLLGEAFANVLNPNIASAFVALFVVALFLAAIRISGKANLGLCIGCHAAWVWQIKLLKDFCNPNPASDYYYLVNPYYDGVVGTLVAVWLGLLLAGYACYKWRRRMAANL